MERFFGDRRITLYRSGTAALSQAMINCAARRSTSTPEVIIPAYGCPDLVAACAHASVYPRLVDVAPSHWGYDQASLISTVSDNTVAIVAVNLLGLGDGSADLVGLCNERQIALIQDSAQHLPRNVSDWPGDYVVLSFGRGKPLNLLHGGALVGPRQSSDDPGPYPPHYTGKDRLLSSRAAAIAFNTLTRPYVYRIFSSLPGTGLGEVIYKPLVNATLLPEHAWERVGVAFELYRQKPSYRRDIWASAIEEWSECGILVLDCAGTPLPAEPLRLALLASDRTARDTLVDSLNRLGGSRFYGADLTGIAEIPEDVKRQGPFPNASSLADRLFTLPTHSLVHSDAINATRDLVREWQRARGGRCAGGAV